MRVLRQRLQHIEQAAAGDVILLQAMGLAPYVGIDTNRGKPRQVIRDPEFVPVDDPAEEDSMDREVETLGSRFVWHKATS